MRAVLLKKFQCANWELQSSALLCLHLLFKAERYHVGAFGTDERAVLKYLLRVPELKNSNRITKFFFGNRGKDRFGDFILTKCLWEKSWGFSHWFSQNVVATIATIKGIMKGPLESVWCFDSVFLALVFFSDILNITFLLFLLKCIYTKNGRFCIAGTNLVVKSCLSSLVFSDQG